MKIHYSTPYSTEKNFGKAINEFCSLIPENDWICVMDGDMMFLTPDWGVQIDQVVREHGKYYSLFGCYTNRLGRPFQIYNISNYDNHNIKDHYEIAIKCRNEKFSQVKDITSKRHIAGMFMLFSKSLWNKINFEENTEYFDDRFSNEVVRSGGKLGLIEGLYVYHSYRIWSCNPKSDKSHLTKDC